MRYPRDTYRQYNQFCKTAVLETETRLKSAELGLTLGAVFLLIAKMLGVSVLAFVGVSAMASAGALAFFGSVGALVAANPILGGVLIGTVGIGLIGVIRLLFKNRDIMTAVKDVVIDRYQSDFDHACANSPGDWRSSDVPPVPDLHVGEIERLVEKAVGDLLNKLVDIRRLSPSDLEKVRAFM